MSIKNNQHYMKRLAIVVITAGVILGGITFYRGSQVDYTKTEPQVIEKEVQVDALDTAIKDAQKLKKEEMESIAQKAYDESLSNQMNKVELEVVTNFKKQMEERQSKLEDKISL
jgi:predicted S18 family serine protease